MKRFISIILAMALAIVALPLDKGVAQVVGGISGTVTNGVAPIPNVTVRVYDAVGGYLVDAGITDIAGFYSIVNLSPSAYKVQFDGTALNYILQYYNGVPTLATATPVTVSDSVVPNINAVLHVGGIISGTITDGSAPLAGVGVTAYHTPLIILIPAGPYFGPSSADLQGNIAGTGYTDAAGFYEIMGLPTGSYAVQMDSNYMYDVFWYTNSLSFAGATTVPATAGGVTPNIDAVLSPAGCIVGTVFDELGPLDGIVVGIIDPATGRLIDSVISGNCDCANGSYGICGLRVGAYKVFFSGGGIYADQWYQDMPDFGSATYVPVNANMLTFNIDAVMALPSPGSPGQPFSGSQTHTIRAFNETGGSLSPSGIVLVSNGGSQTFSITPRTGYVIDDVLVDGRSVGPVNSYTFSKVSADHDISPRFVRSFTIKASAAAGGTISPAGDVTVKKGSDRTFAISALPGYRVTNVFVDGAAQGPIASYTFTDVQVDHVITATFEAGGITPGPGPEPGPSDFTLSASAGPGGKISPEGSITVKPGSDMTFFITADPGYRVASVKVDGISIGPVTTVTLHDIKSGHTIEVTFIRK